MPANFFSFLCIPYFLSMMNQLHIRLDCQGKEKETFVTVRESLLEPDLLVKEEDLREILLMMWCWLLQFWI